MGKMFLSDASKSYSTISDITIRDDITSSETAYYGESHILKTTSEREAFLATDGILFSEKEREQVKSYSDEYIVEYFFVQIPSGYKASKRDNVQGYVRKEDGQILITDNYYYYQPKKENLYCRIDISKDISTSLPYVFSFYFVMPSELSSILNGKIHLLYNDLENTKSQSE